MQPSSSDNFPICEEEKALRTGRVSQADTGAGGVVMSGAQFDALPNMREVHIKKNRTNYCNPVDPEQQLAA